jgi:glycosyltransferase involved in cell wall biosynthesis
VKEKGWNSNGKWIVDLDKLYNLNNGVDLERYEIDKNENIIEDSDLNSKKFKIIYAGSIGYSDQVSKIVYTAELLQKYNKEILFLIYGDGIEKKILEQYCVRKKINNVLFKGRVEKKYIPYILSKSNLNIFPFKQSNLSRFGASLNKLFDYLASSKPILSDCEFKYDIIIRYDAGIVIDNATTNEWAKAILNFYNMNNINYNNYCKNAYSAARDFDFKKLSNDLIKYIKE